MNIVEIKTIMEKKSVHIGSAIFQSSLYQIIADAIKTPRDCTKSPIT